MTGAADHERAGPGAADGAEDFLAFDLAGHRFALPLADVDGIVRLPALTALPMAPGIEGLMNRRGRALAVADLRRACGLPAGPFGPEARVLLVTAAGDPLGLAVERVGGVVRGVAMHLDAAAGDVGGRSPVRRVLDRDGSLIGVLDLEAVVTRHVQPPAGESVPAPDAPPEPGAPGDNLGGAAPADAALQLLALRVGGHELAVPLADVRGVHRPPAAAVPAPAATPAVSGLAQLGGGVLPLVSLPALLGWDGAAGAVPSQRVVVLAPAEGGAPAGLVVDAVTGILTVGPDQVHPTPAAVSAGGLVAGVCALEGGERVVPMLETGAILSNVAPASGGEWGSPAGEAAGEADGEEAEVHLLTVRVAGDDYAIEVGDVSEIVRHPGTVNRVPGAPRFLAGVCALRGGVLPLLDVGARLGAPPAAPGPATRILVTSAGGHPLGLVVDAVASLRRVPAGDVRPSGALGAAGREGAVRGVVTDPAGGALALLLDVGVLAGAGRPSLSEEAT